MFGSIGKALGAVFPVPALGTALGMGESALAYKGQKDANESNERIAKENRAFQERMANTAMDYQTDTIQKAHDYQTEMSNTAYQRAMTDMKSAGLNPILAYQQGGASTPIGQTAPGHTAAGSVATMQNPFGGMSGSPVQSASTAADVNVKRQQSKTLHEQAKLHAAQAGLSERQADRVAHEINKLANEAQRLEADTDSINYDNVQKKILADFYDSAEFARIAKSLGITPSTFGGIIRTFFQKKGKR
nr:MAG: DNA pilot protein [Microvirus sp.]